MRNARVRGDLGIIFGVMLIQGALWFFGPEASKNFNTEVTSDTGMMIAHAVVSAAFMCLYSLIGWGVINMMTVASKSTDRFTWSKAVEIYQLASLVTVLQALVDIVLIGAQGEPFRVSQPGWTVRTGNHASLLESLTTEKCIQLTVFFLLIAIWPLLTRKKFPISAKAEGVTV